MGLFDIFRVGKIKAENNSLKQQLQELHADEYFQLLIIIRLYLSSMKNFLPLLNVLKKSVSS